MPRGGQRPGAGRKRVITDPALIAMIAADYESQRNQLAQDNAVDTIAHHKLIEKLAKANDPNKASPAVRAKIIGKRPRLRTAPITRPWGLRQSIIASLAEKYGVSKRRVEYCLGVIRPEWRPPEPE